MSRILFSIMLCILLAGCISSSSGLGDGFANYEENFTFPGKDTYQLLGLSSKWLKENQGIVEFKEHQREKDTGSINAQLSDKNITLEIIIHNQAVTILCRISHAPGTKVSYDEMLSLVEDFEKYINRFSSMGMWELPEDAEW